MQVITLFNEKGGVGKTTLAVTIAAGLAIKGAQVLLIDADAQANAAHALGISPYSGFYDLIVRDAPFEDVVRAVDPSRLLPADQANEMPGNLYIIGSNHETLNVANSQTDIEKFLNIMILMQETPFPTGDIDFVIVDTPPTPSLLHAMLYMATDATIIPTRLEPFAMKGVRSTVNYHAKYSRLRTGQGYDPIRPLGIVPVATELNTYEHSDNYRYLLQAFDHAQYLNYLRNDQAAYAAASQEKVSSPQIEVWRPLHKRIRWTEAQGSQRALFAIDPEGQATQDAWHVVEKVVAYASAT